MYVHKYAKQFGTPATKMVPWHLVRRNLTKNARLKFLPDAIFFLNSGHPRHIHIPALQLFLSQLERLNPTSLASLLLYVRVRVPAHMVAVSPRNLRR